MSVRGQLRDILAERFEDIRIGNSVTVGGASYDYQTDVGANVLPWRDTEADPLIDDELPALVFRDVVDEHQYDDTAIGYVDHNLKFELVAAMLGATAPEQADAISKDVLMALYQDEKFGGLANWTLIGSVRLQVAQSSKMAGGAMIEFTIFYRTRRWDF